MKSNIHLIISSILIILSLSIWNLKDFSFTDDSSNTSNTFSIIIKHYGVDAKEIEKSITIPLEKRLKSVRGLSNIKSTTEYEKVRITLEMKSDYSYSESYLDVRDKVYSFYRILPKSVQKPQIFSGSNRKDPVLIFSIENSNISRQELQIIADERIKKSIEKIEEAGEVQLGGYQAQEIIIDIDPNVSAALQIRASEIGDILKKNYTHTVIGVIQSKEFRWVVTANGIIDNISAIGNIEIPTKSGNIKLSSLSNIYWSQKTPDSISRINNNRKLVYYVKLSGKGSALSLSSKVAKLIKIEETNGYDFEILYDLGEELKESIKSFLKNMLLCMIVVSFFIFFALRKLKQVLAVSLSIPFYALLTISLLHLFRLPIGLSTLLGLGLAIGTVADSGIIIICSSRIDRSSKSLISSLISSALTTVIVTLPLIISESVSINVQKIALSYFVFVILSTSLNLIILRNIPIYSSSKYHFDFFIVLLKKVFRIKFKYISLISLILLLSVISLLIFLPKSLNDGHLSNTLNIHIELPSGSTLNYIDRKILEVSKEIKKIDGVLDIESHSRKKNGSITVKFNEKKISRDGLIRVIEPKKNMFKDVQIFLPENNVDTKISITITGRDIDTIKQNISIIASELREKKWVSKIVYNFKDGSPIYSFRPDRKISANYNIDPQEILSTLNWALKGPVSLKWQTKGEKEKDLRVFVNANKYSSIDEISRLPIKTESTIIPLGVLGDFSQNEFNNNIYRTNLQRSLSFTIYVKSKKIDTIFSNISNTFESIDLPAGYSYHIDEKLLESKKESRTLLLFLLISLFLIYAVLVITLESFSTPILILITIPLSLILTIVSLVIFSLPFTIEVFVGLIIVMGIIVNNSIIITEMFFDNFKLNGNLKLSIIESVKKRITSIILTTGSTCMGFFPIIIGFSGVESRIRNLAVVIFSGTLGSFFIGICIYPVLLYNFVKIRGIYEKKENI